MAGRYAPPFLNTQGDRGAVVAVVSFTFIVLSTLTSGLRAWVRQRSEVALGLDDLFIAAANIIAIAQTVLVAKSIRYGLGRHVRDLSDVFIARYHKSSYTASILAIISMTLAKLSVLQLQRRLCGLQPTSRYIGVMYTTLASAVIVWAFFGVPALAFQCGASSPYIYQHERCSSGVLWYPVAIFNIVTDAALAFSFDPIIMTLAARIQTKSRRWFCWDRGSSAVIQISSLAKHLDELDQTRAMMEPVILQQIVMNLSILTGVVLGLHGSIANLTAGRFGVEVRDSTNNSTNAYHNRSRKATNVSKALSTRHNDIQPRSTGDYTSPSREDVACLRPETAVKSNAWAQREDGSEWDESDRRSHGSEENMIVQTVTWQVSTHTAPSSMPSEPVEGRLQSSRGALEEVSASDFAR